MPVDRPPNNKQIELDIVGSSTFGKFPKISTSKTINMYISDAFLVPYAGYEVIIPDTTLMNGKEGRGLFTSTKFGGLIAVIDNQVWLIKITYDQATDKPSLTTINNIGTLLTNSGIVYIAENNFPQVLISDQQNLYIYDPTLSGLVQVVPFLNFTPGYITFHDTYFICAASNDMTYTPPANNTWRISLNNQGYLNPADGTTAWPTFAEGVTYVGTLQTKPDNVHAVVRFPSKGNMIFVMGSIVTEAWFDTGSQLFPYQRNNQFNIDYGCLSPASVAYMDEIVVWLASNEKSGPIIMYSDGGMPKKITTDGIDNLFSTLQNPQDSQGFVYRQDGHLFYHINFYSDNLSLFYDFNTEKFFHATDQHLNYFIASEIAFLDNQYYFVSRNTGHLYAFDTGFYTYQDTGEGPENLENYIIPRIRICKNIRLPTQDYFIINDLGFTVESGETNYYQQNGTGTPIPFYLLSGEPFYLLSNEQFNLLAETYPLTTSTPAVFLSMSWDGGAVFGNEWVYYLPAIGYRRNALRWWQLGISNDSVVQIRFESIGRVACTDGLLNLRIG